MRAGIGKDPGRDHGCHPLASQKEAPRVQSELVCVPCLAPQEQEPGENAGNGPPGNCTQPTQGNLPQSAASLRGHSSPVSSECAECPLITAWLSKAICTGSHPKWKLPSTWCFPGWSFLSHPRKPLRSTQQAVACLVGLGGPCGPGLLLAGLSTFSYQTPWGAAEAWTQNTPEQEAHGTVADRKHTLAPRPPQARQQSGQHKF